MSERQILATEVFTTAALLLLCLFLLIRLLRVKNKLRDISDILDDISAGNGNHKILASPDEMTAGICYKINEIVYHYENQLAFWRQESELNKQLMTSLSHDVRTPLTTLIGYLDASHKGIIKGAEREEYMETARIKAHELKAYIDDLFEWFKLGSGEETLIVKPYEIAELTRELLKDFIPVFEEKGLDYEITIPQEQVMVMVDLDGYSRILNNLIQNVLSHSDAGRILISVSIQSGKAVICVADDGKGIPKEALPHIFERLYKCDKARSEKGSGLGLNIVKTLTEKMEGSITADSENNHYTTFTLRFPLTARLR